MFWTLIYILRVLQIQFILLQSIARAPLSSPCKILWTLPLDATDNGGNVSSFRLPYFALIWNKGFWKKPHTLSKCGSVGRMNQTLRTRFPSSWRLFEDNGTLFLQNTKPRLLNMSGKRNIQNGKYFTCGVFIVCCPANKTLPYFSVKHVTLRVLRPVWEASHKETNVRARVVKQKNSKMTKTELGQRWQMNRKGKTMQYAACFSSLFAFLVTNRCRHKNKGNRFTTKSPHGRGAKKKKRNSISFFNHNFSSTHLNAWFFFLFYKSGIKLRLWKIGGAAKQSCKKQK